jgi:very-short-patch-repair endonuclease
MVDQKHKPKWHVSEKQRSNARAVRREMTEVERILRCNARPRRFRGVSLRTVAPLCHTARLIVERDGGQHFEPKTMGRNARRDRYLAAQRCGLVGFSHLDVMENKAGMLEEIAVALPRAQTVRCARGRGPGQAGCEDGR